MALLKCMPRIMMMVNKVETMSKLTKVTMGRVTKVTTSRKLMMVSKKKRKTKKQIRLLSRLDR